MRGESRFQRINPALSSNRLTFRLDFCKGRAAIWLDHVWEEGESKSARGEQDSPGPGGDKGLMAALVEILRHLPEQRRQNNRFLRCPKVCFLSDHCSAENLVGFSRSFAKMTTLKFDGINDYVDIADDSRFSVATTGRLTVAAWMRPDVRP